MMASDSLDKLYQHILTWGKELGFQQIAITDADPGIHAQYLDEWLSQNYHGEMGWMQQHQEQRHKPAMMVPNALRVISARMDYLAQDTQAIKVLKQEDKAYISRYALGRDYHKLVRKRLATLGKRIEAFCEEHTELNPEQPDDHGCQLRPFVDSAPVLEKGFAEKSGLGWIGKNTLLLNATAGSWFFLGEIITNLPLPLDQTNKVAPVQNQCGDCTACLKVCPTDAFVEPYKLDARRCISYLTIELKGSIPEEFREPMGNRVFGCDDCQLICPWNKFPQSTEEDDFSPRHGLHDSKLLDLFLWTEEEFLQKTEGSAIRRIGYERWLRNLAIGLGNANKSTAIISGLQQVQGKVSALVDEHIEWALKRQQSERRRVRKIKAL